MAPFFTGIALLPPSRFPGYVGFLIHSADPQSRPVVIIIFAQICVRTYVPTFQNIEKQNKRREKLVITTCGAVVLAEWIIDDICLVSFCVCRFYLR